MGDLATFWMTFAAVFLAELGDRTQLSILMVSSQVRRPWQIFLGAAAAFTLTGVLATSAGAAAGALLPVAWLELAGGLLFLLFGVLFGVAFVRGDADGDDGPRFPTGGRSFVVGVALAIALAEMGDKTQIATGLLAATAPPVAVFLGATTALVLNAGIAVVVGRLLSGLPAHLRRWVLPAGAVAFLAFGASYVWRAVAALRS